jgi:hypothetical protein
VPGAATPAARGTVSSAVPASSPSKR